MAGSICSTAYQSREVDERRPRLYEIAGGASDRRDGRGPRRPDRQLHLHRLERDQDVPFRDLVTASALEPPVEQHLLSRVDGLQELLAEAAEDEVEEVFIG